jgi:uncharacterized Zn-finger protein
MKPFETVTITSAEVACEGDAGPLGHPRVYLHIDRFTGQIQCPYCSRLFVMETDAKRHAG